MGYIFKYSDIVENQDFVGRKSEVERLSADFVFLTNTMVLAPQGWGKSSLIRKAASDAMHKEKSLRFCYVSLSNVRDEEHFYELLVQGVLRAVSSGLEDALSIVSRFLVHPAPKISFISSSTDGIVIDFDWNDIRQHREFLLDFPVCVAKEKGLKIVICIDDFHAVGSFADQEAFITMLRDKWLAHKGVAYCISAQESIVVSDFAKTAKPFSRYGDIIHLGKINSVAFAHHLRDKFADSGKYLDGEVASMIVDLMDGHPFYIQQLAHLSWMNTSVVCSKEVVVSAHDTIVNQMHLLFSIITASLTSQQLCYLHAVLSGETVMSTSEVLHRHHITSATSASRSKAVLIQKGIIYNSEGKIGFADPVYAYWLRNVYFR